MVNKPIVNQNQSQTKANPVESFKDFGTSTAKNLGTSMKDLGTGMLDQLFGGYVDNSENNLEAQRDVMNKSSNEQKLSPKGKKEASIFNYNEYHESVLVRREIQQLVEQIRKEIQYLKKADRSLLNEVKDIEKIALESLPEKPGVYHIRFLEIVLRTLQMLRAKIGESKTWMQALMSKKKKRGSLFAVRSKKAGTQYSLSQELSTARSVQ